MDTDRLGQQSKGPGVAGVLARPILLFPAAILLGFSLDHLLPLPFVVPTFEPVHRIVPCFLILAGLTLFAAGAHNFSRAETPLPTNQPARELVTTGIYRWTRNPVYLGFFLAYFGIGIATRSPWILVLTLPLAITIRYGIIAREETYLERRFGDSYRDYRAHVRRWL